MARVRERSPGREPFSFRRALTTLLAVATFATGATAAELPLPREAESLPARIASACPTCTAAGYVACGTQDVAWGNAFARTAFQGDPARAYLPTFTMTGQQFRQLARTTDYAPLVATLHDRFATTRLVVIERGFADARVLPSPTTVTVTFPPPLHTCVHETHQPWGCCVGDCKHECCEKGLGSPEVTMEWTDGAEHLTLHYTHTVGNSWLDRSGGPRRIRYACLTETKGALAGDALSVGRALER